MVPLISLWLPVLLSAVFVFIVSSIIHMFLPYHRTDFGKIPSEDEVMDALRKFNIPPGDYVLPYAGSTEVMNSPEFKEKADKGPAAFMTVLKGSQSSMAGNLIQWFLYCVLVGIFTGYVTGLALGPGAEYIMVFRIAGTIALAGFSLALLQNSIWYKRNWIATLKSMFDGLIYALVTAGTMGWLWPAGI